MAQGKQGVMPSPGADLLHSAQHGLLATGALQVDLLRLAKLRLGAELGLDGRSTRALARLAQLVQASAEERERQPQGNQAGGPRADGLRLFVRTSQSRREGSRCLLVGIGGEGAVLHRALPRVAGRRGRRPCSPSGVRELVLSSAGMAWLVLAAFRRRRWRDAEGARDARLRGRRAFGLEPQGILVGAPTQDEP